jgi:V/A-type H+-transporting ATPase subunit K
MAALALPAVLAAGAVAAEASAARKVEEGLEDAGDAATMADVYKTIAIAASVSFVTAVSIIGAGFAVGKVGSAAIGAAAEKPELLTRSLLFVALAEGLAVLGFAVAMMLLAQM